MRAFIDFLKRDVSRLVSIQLTSHRMDYARASTPVQHWQVLIWSKCVKSPINRLTHSSATSKKLTSLRRMLIIIFMHTLIMISQLINALNNWWYRNLHPQNQIERHHPDYLLNCVQFLFWYLKYDHSPARPYRPHNHDQRNSNRSYNKLL